MATTLLVVLVNRTKLSSVKMRWDEIRWNERRERSVRCSTPFPGLEPSGIYVYSNTALPCPHTVVGPVPTVSRTAVRRRVSTRQGWASERYRQHSVAARALCPAGDEIGLDWAGFNVLYQTHYRSYRGRVFTGQM